MYRLIYILLLLLPAYIYCQPTNHNILTESHQTLVYKVNTATVEKFIRENKIDLNYFSDLTPFTILPNDKEYKNTLPGGSYIYIRIDQSSIKAHLENVSNLYVYTVNNRKRLQLLIIDKQGNFAESAKVCVGGKPASYSTKSKTYYVRQKHFDENSVKVFTTTDTLFSGISIDEEIDRSIWQQRWSNFKTSKFLQIVKWPYWAVTHPFRNTSSYTEGASGMIVFNQPKYKKTDTVKVKAYLYNRKRKVFRAPVDVYLEYYDRNKFQSTLINKITPRSPGSYQLAFPLSDTLTANISYSVIFKNRKGKTLIRSSFKVEDYLLDDITDYNFRSDKSIYYPGDTILFYASAKDANGLSVLDATTSLVLKVNNILKFYRDSLYISDTLLVENKKLEAEGDTKFQLPADILKDVSVDIAADLQFKNSNNEIQEEHTNISLLTAQNELLSSTINDTIEVTYRENGAVVPAEAVMVKHDEWNDTVRIRLPHQEKIDPMAFNYTFYLLQSGKFIDSQTVKPHSYNISLNQVNSGDTLGFDLDNPYGIPVTFTVFYGSKIFGSGRSSDQQVKWRLAHVNKHRMYRVVWQYRWLGEETIREDRIAVYYKLLDLDVNSNTTVFPGQRDTITIKAKDYRNNPAEKINLTAFAYNNQFAHDINVPEPPYLMRFAVRQSITRDTYAEDYTNVYGSYALGKFQEWRKKFGIDSMLYYKMIFPKQGFTDMPTPITDYLPQVSIHAVKNGEWQPASMLYINRQLAYYSDVTDNMKDVYSVRRGYTHIGIRLPDRLIEIDSLYLQPYYKHDLFLDIDNLPANSKVTPMPNYLTAEEKLLLENSLLQLDESGDSRLAYLWQRDKVVQLTRNNHHVVGPFLEKDSLHYFKQGAFDIHFVFEPGYEYRLSKKMARLERKPLFTDKKYYLTPMRTSWSFGDTLIAHPEIRYQEQYIQPYLKLSRSGERQEIKGKLLFTVHKDSSIKYVVLYPSEYPNKRMVFDGNKRVIENLSPGNYTLLLVDMFWRTLEVSPIRIIENKTLCLHTEQIAFKTGNSLIWKWWREQQEPEISEVDSSNSPVYNVRSSNPKVPTGNATITGKVSDTDGKLPIIGALVLIGGSSTGTTTDTSGRFYISNIRGGTYVVQFSSVGYSTKEVSVHVNENNTALINVALKESEANLQEVVVTALGITRRKALTSSIAFYNRTVPLTTLSGKVAGVQITNYTPPAIIRSTASIVNKQQLYVINGVLYDALPANISNDMIATMSELDEASAVAIYGSRAANGVIVITTNNGTATRKSFRDYAFWQPELFTDENGEAKFVVEYPDNITGWQLYVLGMDKKLRIGKTMRLIKAFKPVWAELNLPRFLIENDSAEIVGKTVNYVNDKYNLQASFTVNGNKSQVEQISINPKESVIRKYNLSSPSLDTLKTSFNVSSSTGFSDGEEQVIPVLKKGTLQADGQFWMLNKDTSIHFTATQENESIKLYAQNNTLDVLLNEIESLKKYPYACNEQKASKLRGLVLEREIKRTLHITFTEEKSIGILLSRILKAQQFDGGWSWWEGGKSNVYVTNYVLNALLQLRNDQNVEMHLRNGLLYLQEQLEHLNRDELLASLVTMSRAKHLMDYGGWMKKLVFDSLEMHQQWQWIMVSQFMKGKYDREIKILLDKGKKGMLGGEYWGEENYKWYSNEVATTVLAFEVLMKEGNMNEHLSGMVQYFMGARKSGYWRNTVESASIVSVILPYILKENPNFNEPAALQVTGDTSFTVKAFPFEMKMNNMSFRDFNIKKTGGGLTYLTLFQQHWNSEPDVVNEKFKVQTRFEKNGRVVNSLESGEKVTMVVDIKTEKVAEYVMIEIPIPAGCVYAKGEQSAYGMHRELLKDKVVLFSENLSAGNHRFTIDLEARYNGSYTLNPSKASLMYFPVFYGRNAVSRVRVKGN